MGIAHHCHVSSLSQVSQYKRKQFFRAMHFFFFLVCLQDLKEVMKNEYFNIIIACRKYTEPLRFGLNTISVNKVKSNGLFLWVAVKSNWVVLEMRSRKSCLQVQLLHILTLHRVLWRKAVSQNIWRILFSCVNREINALKQGTLFSTGLFIKGRNFKYSFSSHLIYFFIVLWSSSSFPSCNLNKNKPHWIYVL